MAINTASAAYSLRQAYQGSPTVTTAITTSYTAPAVTANVPTGNATAIIKEIIAVNYSGAAVNAQVYLVPNAGSAANANMIEFAPFTASDTKWVSGTNTGMPAGSTIYVQSSVANAVAFTISVTEVQ